MKISSNQILSSIITHNVYWTIFFLIYIHIHIFYWNYSETIFFICTSNTWCIFLHYNNLSIGADKRAPTETPNTKKKQSIDAARLWSRGLFNIFGPYIITILPIYPFDIDIEASNKRNISSDTIYTCARKYYI